VINEINYKSGDEVNAGDWIELYNPNNTIIDVSNWVLKDSQDDHIFSFPNGTIIRANSYLVLVRNENDFTTAFPAITNYIGEFDFGLMKMKFYKIKLIIMLILVGLLVQMEMDQL
jgi:hypothetical protein